MRITESQTQDPRWEPIDTLCLRALCGSTIQHFTSMKVDENSIPPTKKLVWSLLKVKPVRTPMAIFGSLGVCIYVPASRHWLISYSPIHLT